MLQVKVGLFYFSVLSKIKTKKGSTPPKTKNPNYPAYINPSTHKYKQKQTKAGKEKTYMK